MSYIRKGDTECVVCGSKFFIETANGVMESHHLCLQCSMEYHGQFGPEETNLKIDEWLKEKGVE